MRRLLLFRHSKAEPSQSGERDHTRALTGQGRADAARMGIYLARHNLMPDQVLMSPSVRTLETWASAAAAFRSAPPARPEQRIYDAAPQALFDLIAETPKTTGRLMLIGHNPGLHELASRLIASGDINAREQLREELPTSGLAVIDFAFDGWPDLRPHTGRLERFVHPRVLESAAI
ncbi:MAG: SixA phosphatase family protein [Pseudolabrys sp.]